jgi:hypothetical protein
MTTEVSTLNSGNFAEMAKAMGMTTDMSSGSSKQSTLPRLRIWNSPVMGQVDVKGKMKNMEVVEGGMYRLQLPDDTYIYSLRFVFAHLSSVLCTRSMSRAQKHMSRH